MKMGREAKIHEKIKFNDWFFTFQSKILLMNIKFPSLILTTSNTLLASLARVYNYFRNIKY